MASNAINLEEITVNSSRVHGRLLEYMARMMSYDFFDTNQFVRVYVDSEKDFIAFESLQYRVQFCNNEKKLLTLTSSAYAPIVVPFMDFMRAMQTLT